MRTHHVRVLKPTSSEVQCIDHMKRYIVLGTNCSKQMTFEEWLKEETIPEGFNKMIHGYSFWDQGMPLGWAIYQFEKKTKVKDSFSRITV